MIRPSNASSSGRRRHPAILAPALALVVAGCGARSELIDGAGSSAPASRIYVANSLPPKGPGMSPGRITGFDDLEGTGWRSYTGGEQFLGVCSPTLDEQGRIYFVDFSASLARVVRIDDLNGTNLTTFGQLGPGVGQFIKPRGLAFDALGRIHVVDVGAHRLVRIDDLSGAGWTTLGGPAAGAGPAQFNEPAGIAISADGKILVGDRKNHRIVQMDDISGAGWQAWEVPKIEDGSFPWGVAYDQEQRIYVVDFDTSILHRIDNIAGDGHVSFNAPHQSSHVLVDKGGRIYMTVLNVEHAVVAMDDITGAGLTLFGGPGEDEERFTNPCGIAVQ